MNKNFRRAQHAAIAISLLYGPLMLSQTPPPSPTQPIAALLQAHHAWTTPPATIQITGTSTRGKTTGPIKITATGQEEALIEYGENKQVFTSSRRFEDDGRKVTFRTTPGGFAQLDLTGVFLLAQLTGRGITTDLPEPTTLEGAPVQRIRMRSNRSEVHYRAYTVRDEFDVYVNGAGLLSGISRRFYENSPLFGFTAGFAFSEYRDTNGILLPYRIQRYVKGHKVETIAVDTYTFSIPVSSTLFQPRRVQ